MVFMIVYMGDEMYLSASDPAGHTDCCDACELYKMPRISTGVTTIDFQYPSFCHCAQGCDTKWESCLEDFKISTLSLFADFGFT